MKTEMGYGGVINILNTNIFNVVKSLLEDIKIIQELLETIWEIKLEKQMAVNLHGEMITHSLIGRGQQLFVLKKY